MKQAEFTLQLSFNRKINKVLINRDLEVISIFLFSIEASWTRIGFSLTLRFCRLNVILMSLSWCFLGSVTLLLTVGSCVCVDGTVNEPDMSASFCPDHKAPMVLFLDRVYGITDQSFLLHLLEVGFLPDLRASASLDTVSILLWSWDTVAGCSGSVSGISDLSFVSLVSLFLKRGQHSIAVITKRNSSFTLNS